MTHHGVCVCACRASTLNYDLGSFVTSTVRFNTATADKVQLLHTLRKLHYNREMAQESEKLSRSRRSPENIVVKIWLPLLLFSCICLHACFVQAMNHSMQRKITVAVKSMMRLKLAASHCTELFVTEPL